MTIQRHWLVHFLFERPGMFVKTALKERCGRNMGEGGTLAQPFTRAAFE